MLRVLAEGEAVEIAVPASMRARAEEIVRLSRRLGEQGAGFRSPGEVLAPALVYGLAHMQERYSQAALRMEGPQRLLPLADVDEAEEPGRDHRP